MSAEPTQAQAQRPQMLGLRIRQLRRAQKWSLATMSERSRIAVSTLSKVENGMLTLNFDRLQQVATAFDLSLSEFLALETSEPRVSPVPTGRISWARRGTGLNVDTKNYAYYYLCNDLRIKAMMPIRAECKARSLKEFGPLLRHDAEEFIFVAEGKVEVHTELYACQVLGVGDSVYLDSRMGHAFINAGDGPAWIISVNLNADPKAHFPPPTAG